VSNTGEFTCYFFNSSSFKGACGYSGTETGSASGTCGGNVTDTVNNIANSGQAKNTYFAAIPGPTPPGGNPGFTTVTDCGACVQITNGSNTIIATIIDECPENSNVPCMQNPTGELDLSYAAFQALHFSNGNPQNTSWKFIACPITTSIVAVPNGAASNNQYYFQNTVYPISTVNGQGPTQFGYFNIAPGAVTITSSAANQTIHGTLTSGGGSVGAQFTAPAGCN